MTRHPTPSPTAEVDEGDTSMSGNGMTPAYDDALHAVVAKVLTKTERIDTELESVGALCTSNASQLRQVRHDLRRIGSDVVVLRQQGETIKGLLRDIITRLPAPPARRTARPTVLGMPPQIAKGEDDAG